MENLLSVELLGSVGKNIVFWVNHLRFEGKLLSCDEIFIKYFDSRKLRERFVRISEIENLEVKND